MTNSPWVRIKDSPIPDGENVLLYLSEEYCSSKFVVASSMKISNGYLIAIGGLMEFDFDKETILAWRRLEDLEKELPLGME